MRHIHVNVQSKPASVSTNVRQSFSSRFNEPLQAAQDKAKPGKMNFSSVSQEESHPL